MCRAHVLIHQPRTDAPAVLYVIHGYGSARPQSLPGSKCQLQQPGLIVNGPCKVLAKNVALAIIAADQHAINKDLQRKLSWTQTCKGMRKGQSRTISGADELTADLRSG